MALANFFSKNALAAHQILNGMDANTISIVLNQFTVGLAFDSEGSTNKSGRLVATLCTNLLSRLFPRLAIVPLSDTSSCSTLSAKLRTMATDINPDIELTDGSTGVAPLIVVGGTRVQTGAGSVFYAGGVGWWALFSPDAPVMCGESPNPFGASAAACFAVANVFRSVFRSRLERGEPDAPFGLSLFDYQRIDPHSPSEWPEQPVLERSALGIGDTVIAGVGAVGSAAVHCLSHVQKLSGQLTLVDHQAIALTNLQRYILSTQADIPAQTWKVDAAGAALKSAAQERGENSLQVIARRMRWAEYLARRNNWKIERVAMAFDSIGDRLTVQPALPMKILNAWTQLGDLGVSRHLAFGSAPCVGCLYLPTVGGKSEAEQVGDALGFPGAPLFIRELLYSGAAIGEPLIRQVAQNRNVVDPQNVAVLLTYKDRSLREFYSDAVCGGVILTLGGDAGSSAVRAEAPMAFQSVLAGVMLAAAIISDAGRMDRSDGSRHPPTRTVIDLTQPLGVHLEPGIARRTDGLCFCNDADYLEQYEAKYAE